MKHFSFRLICEYFLLNSFLIIFIIYTNAQQFNYDHKVSPCYGEWRFPSNCTSFGCSYQVSWQYIDETDSIMFIVSTKNRNKWTGIGFSSDRYMSGTDAILGLVEETGRFFMMDTVLSGYEVPPLDPVQNIQNMTAWRENGITNLRFFRYRQTGDKKDFQFSDDNCPYLIFPIEGGVFNAVNKRIRKHEKTPMISDNKICIKSCKPKPSTTTTTTSPTTTVNRNVFNPVSTSTTTTTSTTSTSTTTTSTTTTTTTSTTTTPPPPATDVISYADDEENIADNVAVSKSDKNDENLGGLTNYEFDIKLLNEINDESLNDEQVKFVIEETLKSELNGKLTMKEIKVIELKESESGTQLATLKLSLAGKDKLLSKSKLETMIRDVLSNGKISNLTIDSDYLVFKQTGKNLVVNKENEKRSLLNDEHIKWLVIIGGVAALVALVLIQALCMLWRDSKSRKKNTIKDKQMPNSQWKDYSATTASSAYCYENFAVNDDFDGNGGNAVLNGNGLSSKQPHSGKNGYNGVKSSNNGSSKGSKEKNSHFTSGSLSRHNASKGGSGGGGGISSAGSGGYSMSTYASGRVGGMNGPNSNLFSQPVSLQPDFYFMPHQRRYSGEVVRVFVDYDHANPGRK